MTNVLPVTLVAVALGLGAVIVYQVVAPVAPIADRPNQGATLPAPRSGSPAYVPPPESAFAETNARSAFDPARQTVTEPAPSGPANTTPPDIALVGIVIGGANSVALLKREGTRDAISARIGQSIDGWVLARIEPEFVVLRSGPHDFTLRLRHAAGLPQPVLNDATPPAVTDRSKP